MGIRLENSKLATSSIKSEKANSIWDKEIFFKRSHFNNKNKEYFFNELGILLGSGIRLRESLYILGDSQNKENEKHIYEKMALGVTNGENFSDVLGKDKSFNSYDTQSIKIGENTGSLGEVSKSLANYYKEKNQLKNSIINALTYPSIVFSTALLAVVFMLRFVVPMFQDVFSQNSIELPVITKTVIFAADWIGQYGIIVLILIVIGIVVARYYSNNYFFRLYKDTLLRKVPFVGSFLRLIHLSRFTQAISLLVSAKIPILKSIKLSINVTTYIPLKKALIEIEKDLLKGSLLSDSLKKHSVFDSKMTALIRVSEETNQTAYIFKELNNQYAKEVELKSKKIAIVLEPIIILMVGLIVGFVLIAMYLPMFELSNVLS